jgi:hypothetical protein
MAPHPFQDSQRQDKPTRQLRARCSTILHQKFLLYVRLLVGNGMTQSHRTIQVLASQ